MSRRLPAFERFDHHPRRSRLPFFTAAGARYPKESRSFEGEDETMRSKAKAMSPRWIPVLCLRDRKAAIGGSTIDVEEGIEKSRCPQDRSSDRSVN